MDCIHGLRRSPKTQSKRQTRRVFLDRKEKDCINREERMLLVLQGTKGLDVMLYVMLLKSREARFEKPYLQVTSP